jgi:threonine/homoserine/homoserine lactone efflux protein
MSFVPDASILVAFTLAGLVLFITPGPDISLWLAKTVAGGRAAGIAAATGTQLGCIVHSLLAACGLSALIAASPPMFLALRIIGAIYLLWLAVGAVRDGSSLNVKSAASNGPRIWSSLAQGFTVNLSNPKVVLFFLTFLPQFVDANDPHAAGKLLFLGVYFVVQSYPLAVLLVLGAGRLVGGLKRRPGVQRTINWLFAGVFSAFAIKVLATQSR